MAPHTHTITQCFTICGHSHFYTSQCNSSKNPFKRIFGKTCPAKETTNVYSICHDCRHKIKGILLQEGIAAILKYREDTGHRGSVFPYLNERNEVIIVPEQDDSTDADSNSREGNITIGLEIETLVAMGTGKGKERRGSDSSQKTVWPDFSEPKQKPKPQNEPSRMRSQQKKAQKEPRSKSPGSIDTFDFELQELNQPNSSSNQTEWPLKDNISWDWRLGKKASEPQPPIPRRADSLNWRSKPLPCPEIGRSLTQANRTMPPPPLSLRQLASHSRNIGRGRFPVATRSEAERTAEVRATASVPIGAPDINKPLPLPSRIEGRPSTPKPGGKFESVDLGLSVPSKAYIPRFM